MSDLEHPRITEVGRLLAEIDRLREALEKIAVRSAGETRFIAKAALAKEAGQ